MKFILSLFVFSSFIAMFGPSGSFADKEKVDDVLYQQNFVTCVCDLNEKIISRNLYLNFNVSPYRIAKELVPQKI